jgi:Ni,Fe-hydrogenase I small subunit
MGEKDLKANLEFVVTNKEHLLKEYNNKFILVFDGKVAGSYDTYEKAAEEGVRLYGLEANFLVYHLVEKEPLNFIMEAAL